MARQPINYDETYLIGGQRINDNFTELFALAGISSSRQPISPIETILTSIGRINANFVLLFAALNPVSARQPLRNDETWLITNQRINDNMTAAYSASGPVSTVSASTRARQAIAAAINTNTTNFQAYQVPDFAMTPDSDPVFWWDNSYRSQTTGLEVAHLYPLYISFSVCPNPNGTGRDQTGKTFSFCSWSHAQADTPIAGPVGGTIAPIKDATGAPSTYAALVAAGGGFQTVSGNPVMTIPGGWKVAGQITGITLSGYYMVRELAMGPISTTGAIVGTIQGNNSTDYTKPAASHAASVINTADWTASGAAATGSTIPYPCFIYGTTPGLVLTYGGDGDSIGVGEPGDAYGDAVFACGAFKRALVKLNRPYVATSVPGTKASQVIGRSLPMRDFIHSIITGALYPDYGHNERLLSWGTGATTPLPTLGNSYVAGDGNFLSIHRRYNLERRAVMAPGAKVIPAVLAPQQAGGVNAGGTAITSITSVGTLATVTTPVAHGRTSAEWLSVYATDVPAYSGVVQITVTSTTTYTYTLLLGATDLAPSAAAKHAISSAVHPTATQYASLEPYLKRTGAFLGIPFVSANGDPDGCIDLYTALGATHGLYASFTDTQEGTHMLGNNTSGTSNVAKMDAVATTLASQMLAA